MIDHSRSFASRHALDLVEEALTLLRRMPLASLASGFVGSLPFTFVLLLYLLNLVHNPRASEELAGYSASLALLYIWLRIWQSVFAAEIWQARSGNSVFGWTWKEWRAIARRHAVLSPISLVWLLLSAVLIFPFAWIYALHHNLSLIVLPAFCNGESSKSRKALRVAWRQARLWPGSNQLVILLVMLAGFVAFVNFMSLLLLVPYLVRFLTGWESTFTRLGVRLLLVRELRLDPDAHLRGKVRRHLVVDGAQERAPLYAFAIDREFGGDHRELGRARFIDRAPHHCAFTREVLRHLALDAAVPAQPRPLK